MRDPLYESILRGLDGPLDPREFERCAWELLQPKYPTLTPVPGGSDAGMDGAIADGDVEAFPLICTTELDVARNLGKSLAAHQARRARKAVFITSRAISPPKRRELEDQARSLGFTLVNVHEREFIAAQLYNNPRWRKRLLGISGDPPALSAIPLGERPALDIRLIGRKKTMEWLMTGSGDRILVGQPGSGKTFVLHHFARKRGALFVVDKDRGRIADHIRSAAPPVIIVDDAHINREVLVSLRHLRREIGAIYDIIAVCWPGDRSSIQEALGVESAKIRALMPLTRNQIVKVVHATGILGPNNLVREIVDQADGQPGLAVTLALLCMRGDVRKIAFADAIKHSLTNVFHGLVGQQATTVLAAFSVGGNLGMPIKVVARALGMSMAEIMSIATALSAGGVLSDARVDGIPHPSAPDCLVVRPSALRAALVRDVFFGAKPTLPINELLLGAPDRASAVECMIAARARNGKQVPDALIRENFPEPEPEPVLDLRLTPEELQVACRKSEAIRRWRSVAYQYACLGAAEAQWAVGQYPEIIDEISSGLLYVVPRIVLPRLLRRARGDDRALAQTPTHPVRIVLGWIQHPLGTTTNSLRRRRTLIEFCEDQSTVGEDSDNVLRFACIALTPTIDFAEADPGAGNKVTVSRGNVSTSELVGIRKLWPRVLKLVREMPEIRWSHIFDMLYEYVHPMFAREEAATTMRAIAHDILTDIVPLASGRPGALHQIERFARVVGFKTPANPDPDFELVFGEHSFDDYWKEEEKRCTEIRGLAVRLVALGTLEGTRKILALKGEALASGVQGDWRLNILCEYMASIAQCRVPWVEQLLDLGGSADAIRSFIHQAAAQREPMWRDLVTRLLGDPSRVILAVEVALIYEDVSTDLFGCILDRADDVRDCLGRLRAQLDEERTRRLLSHQDDRISGAAAIHEWRIASEHKIRASLCDAWNRAIVNIRQHFAEHDLKTIFASNHRLAAEWLFARISEEWPECWRYKGLVGSAIKFLTRQERLQIIAMIRPGHWSVDILQTVVGGTSSVYRHLLSLESHKQLHLIPLRSSAETIRCRFLLLALRAGYSPQEVASEITSGTASYAGLRSEYLRRWVVAFEQLASCSVARLRQIGRCRLRDMRASYRQACKEERRKAVYGRRF